MVRHPLLDRIRQHSAKPDRACSFFIALLSPDSRSRHDPRVLEHPYLKSLTKKMERDTKKKMGESCCLDGMSTTCPD